MSHGEFHVVISVGDIKIFTTYFLGYYVANIDLVLFRVGGEGEQGKSHGLELKLKRQVFLNSNSGRTRPERFIYININKS